MSLFCASTVFLLISFVKAQDFVCETPPPNDGPKQPVLPESYRMVYESNDLVQGDSTFFEVWFDWPNQRARIRQVSPGFAINYINFYSKDASYSFYEEFPGKEEIQDPTRDFSCRYMTLWEYEDASFPFFNPTGIPRRMVDSNQALLFGGPYEYVFKERRSDEESRHIDTNVFTACVTNALTKQMLNVTYYWTIDDSQPVSCRMQAASGGVWDATSDTFVNRTDQLLSIVLFERDPVFNESVFQVPRHMHCQKDPAIVEPENLPKVQGDFSWREESIMYDTNRDGVIIRNVVREAYTELWSSKVLNLARMDYSPSDVDSNGTWFQKYEGQSLEIVADPEYGAIFVTNRARGTCDVVALTEDFPLLSKINGTFALKTAEELLGMTESHILKGNYTERNNDVIVYSRGLDDIPGRDSIATHEFTFRFDERMNAIPVSQLNRTLFSDPDSVLDAQQRIRQKSYFRFEQGNVPFEKFQAPECVARHRHRIFEMSFDGSEASHIVQRRTDFLNQVRYNVFAFGELGTLMRVQNMDLFTDNSTNIVVTMTLLEILPEIASARKVTIDEAITSITNAIDEKAFIVEIKSLSGSTVTLRPIEDSLKEVILKKEQRSEPTRHRAVRSTSHKSVVRIDHGYGIGTLMGVFFVAFILGSTCGFAAIFLVRKRRAAQLDEGAVQLSDITVDLE